MPSPSSPPATSRRRKARNYAKNDDSQDIFHFWSDGHDGINMYGAYVGALRRLEGRDDAMLNGYGTKVTYIIDIDGREYSEQKYAHDKQGPATGAKVSKQVAQVLWRFVQQQHSQQDECSLDLLKIWYLLRIERANKSAFLCVLECRQASDAPSSSHTPTIQPSPALPPTPIPLNTVPTPRMGEAYAPPLDHENTTTSRTRPFSPAMSNAYQPPSIHPEVGDSPLANGGGACQGSTQSSSRTNVTLAGGPSGTTDPYAVLHPPFAASHASHCMASDQAQEGPLNAAELVLFRRLLGRFLKYSTAGASDMVQYTAHSTTHASQLVRPDISSHDDYPVAHKPNEHPSRHESDMQTSRTEETRMNTFLEKVAVYELELESIHAHDTLGEEEASSDNDDSESEESDEARHVLPTSRIMSEPRGWKLHESLLSRPATAGQFEEEFPYTKQYCNFATQLFTFLRQHFPEEPLGFSAAYDVELHECSALKLYYRPLKDKRGQRNLQGELLRFEYALAVGASNERAYCSIYNFFQVTLPSGRTEGIALVHWLERIACSSALPFGDRQVYEIQDKCVFIPITSIIHPSKLDYYPCHSCARRHLFSREDSIL